MSRSNDTDLFEGLPPSDDGREGQRLKDAGIARINSHNQVWHDNAMSLLLGFRKVKGVNVPFTIEDFREWAELPSPPHFNCFGAFWNSAAKTGLIRWTEAVVKSRFKSAHAGTIKVWIFPG